jgi:hypothetical protein
MEVRASDGRIDFPGRLTPKPEGPSMIDARELHGWSFEYHYRQLVPGTRKMAFQFLTFSWIYLSSWSPRGVLTGHFDACRLETIISHHIVPVHACSVPVDLLTDSVEYFLWCKRLQSFALINVNVRN